jgi:hypothetical protein
MATTFSLEIDFDDIEALAKVLKADPRTSRYGSTLSHAKYNMLIQAEQVMTTFGTDTDENSFALGDHARKASREIGLVAHIQGLKK